MAGARVRSWRIEGAAEQRGKRDVIGRTQVRQQARELEDEADIAAAKTRPLGFRHRPDVKAIEKQLAFRRLGQGTQQRQEGGLAGTRSADDRYELALVQLQIGIPDRLISRSGTVSLGHRLRRQDHVNALPRESGHRVPFGGPAMPAAKRQGDREWPRTRLQPARSPAVPEAAARRKARRGD